MYIVLQQDHVNSEFHKYEVGTTKCKTKQQKE